MTTPTLKTGRAIRSVDRLVRSVTVAVQSSLNAFHREECVLSDSPPFQFAGTSLNSIPSKSSQRNRVWTRKEFLAILNSSRTNLSTP